MMNGHLFPALEYYPWVSIVTVMWTLLHGSDGKGPCLYADRSWVLDATFLEVMMAISSQTDDAAVHFVRRDVDGYQCCAGRLSFARSSLKEFVGARCIAVAASLADMFSIEPRDASSRRGSTDSSCSC